jgi:glutathionylspermidine synthase
MYSKEEALQVKKEFWISFANEYPRKWLLYNTKIKDFSFKFNANNKIAMVSLDIEPKNNEHRIIYFQKIESLQTILREDYLADALFNQNLQLDNGKIISRVWVQLNDVSINNKGTWPIIFEFFSKNMELFELFFYEYEEYIKDLELNT